MRLRQPAARDVFAILPERSKNIAVRDEKFRERILWAIAISIALHEIVGGLWPHGNASPAPEPTVVAERIKIERPRPTPRPTPVPTPRPTPHVTPAPHYTLAPKVVVRAPAAKAAATPTHTLGGAAAHKRIVHVTPPPVTPKPAPPESLAEGTQSGKQNGGSGTGGGAGAGTGGLAGTGEGSGTTGNGNGGDTNSAPCGTVEFIPGHFSYNGDGSMRQAVSVLITLRDGEEQSGDIPYPFIYSSEKENPFLHDDKLSKNGGVFLQPPPPGSDVSKMPPAVQIVIAHTDPTTGATTFPDCPAAATKSK